MKWQRPKFIPGTGLNTVQRDYRYIINSHFKLIITGEFAANSVIEKITYKTTG